MSITIGLDIGTTAVRAARLTDHGAVVPDGAYIPAVVGATTEGFVVGEDAATLIEQHPDRAARSFLHLLGAVERPLPAAVVGPAAAAGPAPTAKQAVTELVARAVATAAPEAAAEGVGVRAVVAVRPSVPLRHRLALADAVRRAGVEVVRLVPSTSCAAAATLADAPAGTFLVLDGGGSGLSLAVIDTGSGVLDAHYATSTDRVAGEGWHHAVAATIARWVRAETGADPASATLPYARLLAAARAANHELTATGQADLRIPDYLHGLVDGGATSPSADLALRLTTDVWRRPAATAAADLRALVSGALDAADWSVPDLDGAVLVGGTTALPVFAETLALDLGVTPLPAPSPTEVVAAGAAIVGGVLTGAVHDLLLLHGAAAAFEFDDPAGRTTTVLPAQTGVPTRATAPVRPDTDFDGSTLAVRFRARCGPAADPEPVALASVAPEAGDQVLAVTDVDANETTVVALAVEGEPVWSTVVSPHVLDAAAARPGGPGRGVIVLGADDDREEVASLATSLATLGFDAAALDATAEAVDTALAAAACVVAVITERGPTSWRLVQRIGLATRLGRPVAGLQLVATQPPLADMAIFTPDTDGQADGQAPDGLLDWLRARPTAAIPTAGAEEFGRSGGPGSAAAGGGS